MLASARRGSIVAAGVALVLVGAMLSRTLEANLVAVESRVGEVPVLRVRRTSLAANAPRALLAHGFTASKETMFRLAEGLAAAGFDCLAFDARGHGASTLGGATRGAGLQDLQTALKALAPIGPRQVEVLVGHSMGGYLEGEAIGERLVEPRLLVAIGAAPDVLSDPPQETLFLLGSHDELLRPSDINALAAEIPGASALISPHSDHALETFDPVLVDAAVGAACRATGLPAPGALTAWQTRLAGGLLLLLGALLALHGALPRCETEWRAAIVGAGATAILLAAAHLAVGRTWLATGLLLRRVPRQLGLVLGLAMLSRILGGVVGSLTGRRRFASMAGQGALALSAFLGAAVLRFGPWPFSGMGTAFVGMAAGLGGALIVGAGGLGAAAEWRLGQPAAADVVFGGLLGYALGQWLPL